MHSTSKENKDQSSSSSSWNPLVREDAASSAHGTERPGVRLTPALKFREEPSIEFQTLSDEGKDMKDHMRNMCSLFWTDINKLEQFLVNEAIWSMFMNDCMWAAFYLSEIR